MIDGIADDVQERITQQLDQFAIEFDLAAFNLDFDLFAEIGRDVTDHPVIAAQQRLDRLHPHPRHRGLHFRQQRRESAEVCGQRRGIVGIVQLAFKLVTDQDHVRHAAHHPVDQAGRQADRALRIHKPRRFGRHWRERWFRCPGSRNFANLHIRLRFGEPCNQRTILAHRDIPALRDRFNDFLDPVDYRQHRIDQPRIDRAFTGPDIAECILGGVRQRLEARKIEKTAIALDRMNEPKNLVEPLAVVGLTLPCHEPALESFKHLTRFGDEFGNQVIHPGRSPCPAMAQDS